MRLGPDHRAGGCPATPDVGKDLAEFGFKVVALEARLRIVEKCNLYERQAEPVGPLPVVLDVHLAFDGRVAALPFARVAAIDNVNGLAHPTLLSREDMGRCKANRIG